MGDGRSLLERSLSIGFGTPARPLAAGTLLLFVAFFLGTLHEAGPATAQHRAPLAELLSYFSTPGLWHEITRDLGIALISASVISLAIERQASEERRKDLQGHVQTVSRKVLDYYFERELPEGWFEHVRDAIKRSTFFRSAMVVQHSICMPSEAQRSEFGEFSIVENNTEYTVRNISQDEQEFSVLVYIEGPLMHHRTHM